MSLANDIREAVLYDSAPLNENEVLNKVLSAFMQQGEWLNDWTHALTFALLVAEALDANVERDERVTQLLRIVERARVYISDQRAILWRTHVNPRTGKVEGGAAEAIQECDVLLLGLSVGARRLMEPSHG